MGTFFGTVHVRTDDRAAVQKAAETVAASQRIKFFLAPTIDGWTTLFPSGNGQDDKPPQGLAAALPHLDILQIMLHDDDVFAFNFFRNGRLLDEYSSLPDYFGPVSEEVRDRLRGRPEQFADLLGANLRAVDVLLHQPSRNAHSQYDRFAQLLNLPNAATAFEYLEEDKGEGITRFAEFLQIPDPTVEKAAKRQQRAAITATLKSARAKGLLLADYVGAKDRYLARIPRLSPAGNSEFVLAWSSDFAQEPVELLCLAPPYPKRPKSLGVQGDYRLHSFVTGPTGRSAVLAFAGGKWEYEIWDLSKCCKIATHTCPANCTCALAYSRDESFFVVRSIDGLYVVDAATGVVRRQWMLPGEGQVIALHPSMRWAVTETHFNQPAIVDLQSTAPLKRLLLGGPYDPAQEMRRQISLQMAIASETVKAAWQKQLDDLSTDTFPLLRAAGRGNEALRAIAFSDDGTWLLLGTDHGARAYLWQSVLDAPADHDVPSPIYAADAEPVTVELSYGHQTVYAMTNAVAFDRWSGCMLFTGLEGAVRSLNLQTGERQTLLEIPGRPPITFMDISFDHTIICLRFAPVLFEGAPKTPWHVQLWRNPGAKP